MKRSPQQNSDSSRVRHLESELANLGSLFIVSARHEGALVLKEVVGADSAVDAKQQARGLLRARGIDPSTTSISCVRTTPRRIAEVAADNRQMAV